jgi:REP element-mobilizing transposase RayT
MSQQGYTIHDQKGTFFLTATVVEWVELFIRPQLADIIIDSLRYCCEYKGLQIHAWCLMPNHLHLLASHPEGKLSDTVRDFKRHTAKMILAVLTTATINESRKKWLLNRLQFAAEHLPNQNYKVWQHGNHPVECFSRDFTEQKMLYIHENPVKAGLVWNPEDYRYSSAVDYLTERKGLLPIKLI